jgi:arylsulfatase A-like enzyme
VDSLRADHLSCLGYSRKVSPHIDQLASEGTLFTQAIANGPRSPASVPAILASLYLSPGTGQGLPQKATTLAEILKEHGYATAGFCAGNPYLSRYCGYQKGFDLFQDFLTFEPVPRVFRRESKGKLAPLRRRAYQFLKEGGVYDPAFHLFYSTLRGRRNVADVTKGESAYPFEGGETLNEQAAAWFSHLPSTPFFLWLHYMDVHFPYLPRVSQHHLSNRARFALSLICLLFRQFSFPRRVMIDLYDDRIQHEDAILGQLLDLLSGQQLYENTVIVLTADHGDEFREHGGWTHLAKLYDELLRVPLIMRGPGLAQNAIVTDQIGLIDLVPTLLELLNIEEKAESFQGASFLSWLRNGCGQSLDRYVFSEAVHLGGRWPPLWGEDGGGRELYRIRSCRSENWKYIWDEEGSQRELYHLRLDPRETRNLVSSEPGMTSQFESIMREQFSRLDSSESATVSMTQRVYSQQEEEEIVRRLHDLGYF